MARPSKLTERVQNELCRLLTAGVVIERACETVGIDDSTYRLWRIRGRKEAERRERPGIKPGTDKWTQEEPYFAFFTATSRAIAEAEVNATLVLRQGMLPQDIVTETTETVTETRLTKDGKPYQYTRTVTRREVRHQGGDWRAAIEWLKRRRSTDWAEHTVLRSEDKEGRPSPVAITIVPPPPLPECVTDNGDSG